MSMSGLIPMFCNDVFVLPSRVKRFEYGINMLSQNVSNKLTLHTHPRRPKTPNYTMEKA
jgi:hypothetical protein